MLELSKDIETLHKAVKICKLPEKFRTAEEVDSLCQILSHFDIFKNKVPQEQLPEILRAAAMNLKYMKVHAGHFLYHRGEPSSCIYFILKGEAWKYRQKTECELERETKVVKDKRNNPVKSVPKILETIRLAKASKERDVLSLNQISQTSITLSTKPSLSSINAVPQSLTSMPSFVNASKVLDKIPDNPSLESLDTSGTQEMDPNEKENGLGSQVRDGLDAPHSKMHFNSIIKKIMNKRDVLNFENDYFFNLVKRDDDLVVKYIRDNLNIMRFESKICPGEEVGELSMSLNHARTSSILAYTNLYVFYLDQKGYEKVFTNQIEEVREKVEFFANYFQNVKYDILKRMCFLFKEQKFKIGDIIYKEESSCDDLYFIKTGEVQLLKKVETEGNILVGYEKNNGSLIALSSEPRKNQKNVIVASIVDGYFFGEEALLENSTRQFTAKSISNLLCYKITSKVLAKLPKDIRQQLHNFALSKQSWEVDRLHDITNKPVSDFKVDINSHRDIPKRLKKIEPKSRLIESQSYQRLVTLEKSLDKHLSPKRHKEPSRDFHAKTFTNFDENPYRFKLQQKSEQEDKNPYVLKHYPEGTNIKRQTLSIWKRSIHVKKERPAGLKTGGDQRSISTSNEDLMSHFVSPKATSRPIKTETEVKSFYGHRVHTESSISLPKKVEPKGDLKNYLMRNLQTKYVNEINQRNQRLNSNDFTQENATTTTQETLQGLLQSVVCLAKKEKSVETARKPTVKLAKIKKVLKPKEPVSANRFQVQSLTSLENSYYLPSFSELVLTQKNAAYQDSSSNFITIIPTASFTKIPPAQKEKC